MAAKGINTSENIVFKRISDNLDGFVESINCLLETYSYSEGTLNQQYCKAEKQFNDFLSDHAVNIEGEYSIPMQCAREYNKYVKKKRRAEKAFVLIPPTYIVSLVSLYDTFFAELVRCVYLLCPQKLNESGLTFDYKELQELSSLEDVKTKIIEHTVESLLRDSHTAQINWLEKALGIDTLKKFEGWSLFIELTERRNLFVHSGGKVSLQYVTVCSANNALLPNVSMGDLLTVDRDYFNSAYELLYKMGVMLTQILLHALYLKTYPADIAKPDGLIIANVYELISEKKYNVAISISEFALDRHFIHTAIDRSYIILNMAQAYKWGGDDAKCRAILDKEDSTTWSNELLIPMHTLLGNYDEVYSRMKSVGSNSEVLTATNYREWPIFRELRKEETFKALFFEIFGEQMLNGQAIIVESTEKSLERSIQQT